MAIIYHYCYTTEVIDGIRTGYGFLTLKRAIEKEEDKDEMVEAILSSVEDLYKGANRNTTAITSISRL